MVLTLSTRIPPNADNFPTLQLFILAVCRVAEPIALTSCFPYAWVMVRDFHVGDGSNASFYAGLFISAFSFAESLTGMFWGCLSDRMGRKPVLLIGCGGTMLSMLVVGFAPNFWVALVGRALGGLLNGNIGVIQTMVGEIVQQPEHEPRAYAVMPFVWSIGTIIGPAIGGLFANPSVSLPSVFPESGLFTNLPYLLPNLICATLLLISIVLGYFLLLETHPSMQGCTSSRSFEHAAIETPLLATSGALADSGANLRGESYGTINAVNIQEKKRWLVSADGRSDSSLSARHKVFSKPVIMVVVALGIFTYHSMTYDHLLPIFLQDGREGNITTIAVSSLRLPGGLGLTVQAVGLIMSINGLIALFVQAVIFPLFATWLGVWKLFLLVTILHPIDYIMVPYLALLPANLLYPGVWVCLAVRNFTSILAYPLLLILLKEASPSPLVLGKINGLAASAAAACRTIAPPFAGYLYGLGAQQGFTGLAFWGSGLVAFSGTIQAFWVKRERNKTATVRPVAPCLAPGINRSHNEMVCIGAAEAEV